MEKQNVLTRVLAVAGTILVWLPLLAPVLLTTALAAREGIFRFDYLLPAELFPLALAGGVLLLWAALRTRSRRKLIGWSLGLATVFLLASQGIAVVTGLAHGANEPAGWRLALVLAALLLFVLFLIALGVAGLKLLRDLL